MQNKKRIQSNFFIVFLHISVWSIIFILPLFFERNIPHPSPLDFTRPRFIERKDFYILSTLLNLSFLPLFYINAYLLVPKFFNKKDWFIYIVLILVTLALIIGFDLFLRYMLVGIMPPFPIRIVILMSIFMLITSTAFSLIQQSIKAEEIRREKEAENMKTELSFLRSQVSPHFLFNTMNNLVSLARKKSNLLEPSLIKLSGLLQYMLYESDDEKISIHKEIEYLDNYIELQKLRFGNNMKIDFNVSMNSTADVVPMILIPFVENAFKHGMVFIKEPEINITLILNQNRLTFMVKNKFNTDQEEKDRSSGIGLSNAKRRLNLLYPDSELKIVQEDNWHMVTLSIIL
ncbi:MAG TPA: histidine kinase [Bacteroidia bacterium]|jgi:sensor histidine kinase YesM|nr:histidine kinase [Bacteroidia bacterium]